MRNCCRLIGLLLCLGLASSGAGAAGKVDNVDLTPLEKVVEPGEAQGAAGLAPAVVATVGGSDLTRDQLAAVAIGLARRQALETLIKQEVVRQEAKRRGVTVTQQEIDAYVKQRVREELRDMARRLNLRDSDELCERLGRSPETLGKEAEATIRPFVGPELLARKLIRRTIEISDAELRGEYASAYGPRVRIRQIVVRSRSEAQEVIKKLEMGVAFDALAREVSVDRVSRREGGVIAPIPITSGLGEAAYKLKPRKISGVIQTANGFHVVELLEKIPAREERFEEVKDALLETVMERRMTENRRKWLNDLLRKAKIKRFM